MDPIWSPWRMSYLERIEDTPPEERACIFCSIGSGRDAVAGMPPGNTGRAAADTGVIWRGSACYALLNAFPYANGHVMLAPYAHVAELDALPGSDASELMQGAQLIMSALRRVYHPDGFNVGANLGTAAGAGFGGHVHLHLVPRWHGDTNFMTTVGRTRVIPEELSSTAHRLEEAVNELQTEGRS